MDLEQHKSMKRMVKRILRETKMSEEKINKQKGLQKNLREIENDLEEDKWKVDRLKKVLWIEKKGENYKIKRVDVNKNESGKWKW